ncbi:MAG: acyl carrier protein [Gemmatimonadota bacterium]|nr:acyl carrier protein [Gemmatimonadota bacterium]
MSNEEILAVVGKILGNNDCRIEEITENTLIEGLEMDSVNLTNVLIEMEEHFQVVIPDSVWSGWTTIQGAVEYILNYRQESELLNRPLESGPGG